MWVANAHDLMQIFKETQAPDSLVKGAPAPQVPASYTSVYA